MIYKHQATLASGVKTAHSRMFATLLLTGILSLFSSLTLLDIVVAAPFKVADTNASLLLKNQTGNPTNPRLRSQKFRLNRLPANILNAIRQDLARQVSISKLTVVSSKRQNWTDGCLGLGTLVESCLAAKVPGWRVVVSDSSRSWTYRTDSSGKTLRVENATNVVNLRQSVTNAVLRQASQYLSVPISQLQIVKAERTNWSDGCLGLSTPGIGCTLAIVPGWRIVVANGQQRWVYRTNESGSAVKLDTEGSNISDLPASVVEAVLREASQYLNVQFSQLQIVKAEAKKWPNQCLGITKDPRLLCGPVSQETIPGWQVVVAGGEQRLVYRTNESGSTVILDEATNNISDAGTIKPTKMTASELPPPIPVNAVFRAIMSGGITGRTYKTTLLNNGQVIRELINNKGISSQHQTTNISPEQVKEFQSLLETQQFSQFDRLNYDLLRGAADNTNVTLTSRSGTTRYDNTSQNPLPQRLNKVIQAWNKIANRGSFGYLK